MDLFNLFQPPGNLGIPKGFLKPLGNQVFWKFGKEIPGKPKFPGKWNLLTRFPPPGTLKFQGSPIIPWKPSFGPWEEFPEAKFPGNEPFNLVHP